MKDTASLKRHQVIFDPGNERTKHNKLAKPKFSEHINKEKKSTPKYIYNQLTGLCFFPFDPGADPRFAAEEDGWWGAVTVWG